MYYLITPVYNEERNIKQLIETVDNQTIKPIIWYIVDNGSTDETTRIVKEMESNRSIDYIHLLFQERTANEEKDVNYNNAVNKGFRQSISDSKLGVEYIGKIDADVLLPPDFFETLIRESNENPNIGVCSGKSFTLTNNLSASSVYSRELLEISKQDEIIGSLRDIRLYRVVALMGVGELPSSRYGTDTLLLMMLEQNGWEVYLSDNTHFILTRPTTCMQRSKDAFVLNGKIRYHYHNRIDIILLNAAYEIVVNKNRYGAFILFGFILSFINQDERLNSSIIDFDNNKQAMKKIRCFFSRV